MFPPPMISQRLRSAFPILVAALLAFPAFAAGSPKANPNSDPTHNLRRKGTAPNVILILADDLGWGDLGCYGQEKIRTPNIDRLAASGMRFTQAYAGNTVCAPSRSALMTGMHSGHGRVRSNVQVPLQTDDVTLAEVFKTSGLRCAAVGKWALGWEGTTGHPNRQGFEDWFGFLDQGHAHDYYPSFLWRNEVRFSNWRNANGERIEYAPDWFARFATNYVQVHEDHPFFLYVASTFPHANNERGARGMEVPDFGSYAREDWPEPEKGKAAMIERLDRLVGEIVGRVNRSRIGSETVILFTSDNGPHVEGGVSTNFFRSSGPFRGLKRSLYEGGIRVPLLVSWPGHIAAGTTNDLPVALWDLLPTLAELTGSAVPAHLDGVSFAASLFGKVPTRRPACLYWESHENGYAQAVRFDDWKAVRPGTNAPVELYHLGEDPGETRDRASEQPETVARAMSLIRESALPWTAPIGHDVTPRQSWQAVPGAAPK
jgi:arylsulfatase A-like enzyme